MQVVLEDQEEQAVAVHQVPSRQVVRAAAEQIVWAVTVLPAEEVTARSAAEAPTSLAPAAAEAVVVWAVEALVVVAAAEEEAVAAEVVAVGAEEEVDAGDEQFTKGANIYEIEITYHEITKNFARLFNRCCGGCLAGRPRT